MIIISDLHLGVEAVLRAEGLSLPHYQKKIIMERLKKIIKKYSPKKLVINGDFKHEFGKNLRQEWREIREILQSLSEKTEVLLIRGNHDNFLKTIASKFDILVKWKKQIGDIEISHGHREKENMDLKMIVGHEHPFIKIRDKVGATLSLPCFLYSDDIIVMPAFSPLASGTNITTVEKQDLLTPVLKDRDIGKLNILAITNLGLLDFAKVEQIQKVQL